MADATPMTHDDEVDLLVAAGLTRPEAEEQLAAEAYDAVASDLG